MGNGQWAIEAHPVAADDEAIAGKGHIMVERQMSDHRCAAEIIRRPRGATRGGRHAKASTSGSVRYGPRGEYVYHCFA